MHKQCVPGLSWGLRMRLEEDPSGSRKQKYMTSFTAEDHAKLGKYAAENGVAMAQKHFKQLNLIESTVRYFREKYLTKAAK